MLRHTASRLVRGSLSYPRISRAAFATKFDLQHSPVPLTKIVATIGPTSEQAEPLKECVNAGMGLMRLNFSHATPEEVHLRCTNLAAADCGHNVSILLDTKGPELRTGKLANDVSGHDTVDMVEGTTVTLHAQADTLPDAAGSTATDLLIQFPVLAQVLEPGRQVLLDDGAVVLKVVSVLDTGRVETVVQHPGSVRSRAGVNLPKADTAAHLPALSEKDKADIAFGMEHADIDFVAASFVQTAQHVEDIRSHCEALAKSLPNWTGKPIPHIISKIETATALDNFDEILAASDGIMVARGDVRDSNLRDRLVSRYSCSFQLGVEIPLVQVTVAQKEMVRACKAAGKPVIVATQMLETMTKKYAPTRAEVADVTNAVVDGADCVMLSGETAKGIAPANVISTMQQICTAAEYSTSGRPAEVSATSSSPLAQAVVAASAGADAILTANAALASVVSGGRPSAPIFANCTSPKEARMLQICRGVVPVVDSADLVEMAKKQLGSGKTAVLVDSQERLSMVTL